MVFRDAIDRLSTKHGRLLSFNDNIGKHTLKVPGSIAFHRGTDT